MLREVISYDWITILIVICITILTVVKFSFGKRLSDFSTVIVNSNYFKTYSKDNKFFDNFNALLFVNQVFGLTIFVYLLFNSFVKTISFDLLLILKVIGIFFCIKLGKFFLELFTGWLFDINTLISSYLFQKMNYKNYMGIVLIPINIILTYTAHSSNNLFYIFIILLVALNLIGFITSFRSNQKLLLGNFFYFILYLCTLEIGPYIILYKLIN